MSSSASSALAGSGKSTLAALHQPSDRCELRRDPGAARALGSQCRRRAVDVLKLNAERSTFVAPQDRHDVSTVQYRQATLGDRECAIRRAGLPAGAEKRAENFSQEEKRQALANLKRVGLLDHAYKRADELSGGEQQRVAIARTLMQQPAIILADEPVSSLDPRLSRVVLDILKRVCREDGITALVSLHTLELTREYADRVIGLKDGQIIFDGPTENLSDAVVDAIYQRDD